MSSLRFLIFPPYRYCRFYLGRRSEDDARQISRFNQVMGPTGRFRTNLMNQIIRKNTRWNDVNVSPVIRQTLQHWAYRMTEVGYASTQVFPPFFPAALVVGHVTTHLRNPLCTMSNPAFIFKQPFLFKLTVLCTLMSAFSSVCPYPPSLSQADFKAYCKKKGLKVQA